MVSTQKSSNSDKVENFFDLLNLTNLVHSESFFIRNNKPIIDLIWTNSSFHFQKTDVVKTGLSDYHKMISAFFKACSSTLKNKVIYYRSYKEFKVGLLLFKKNCIICFIESPLKMMKNAFYFILKALFVLNIFKFCHDFLVM